jgi:hypothetical protein
MQGIFAEAAFSLEFPLVTLRVLMVATRPCACSPKHLFDSNYAFANDRPFQRTRPERSRVGDPLEQADNKG